MRPDSTGDVDGAAAGADGAPPARTVEWGTKGPALREGVEDQGARECSGEVVGGGGEEDEFSGDGDGLDGEVAREEGRVTEEEVVEGWVRWWRREDVPFG